MGHDVSCPNKGLVESVGSIRRAAPTALPILLAGLCYPALTSWAKFWRTYDATMLTARRQLPEEGEEAGAGAEAVVGIAGEIAAEHFFFVKEAEDDQGDNSVETRKRPAGA